MQLLNEPTLEPWTGLHVPTWSLRLGFQRSFGLRRQAWPWRPGRWIVGYGHWRGVRARTWGDEDRAEEWLEQDIEEAAIWVDDRVTTPINSEQFNALCYVSHFARADYCDITDAIVALNTRGREQGAAIIHAAIYGRDYFDRDKHGVADMFQRLWRGNLSGHDTTT